MQMYKRLLLIIAVVLFSACAKPPTAELQDARSLVNKAYAAGAVQFAPGQYQLANSALQAAELQVESREYDKAFRTLALAQRYADEALQVTVEEKQKLEAARAKAAEKKRLAELKKQQKIKEKQEQKKQQELKKRLAADKKKKSQPVKKAPDVVKPELVDEVTVFPGENLANIAARKEVYGDPFLWPLIYKANRDQIKDPVKIFEGQILKIPRDKSRDDADAARREARELKLFELAD